MTEFPEPRGGDASPPVLLARYLDFYRATAIRKVTSLPQDQQRATRLPSGWSPIEMLSHLFHMERRWFVWGFLGEQVDDPWADDGPDGERWRVADEVTTDDLTSRMLAQGERVSQLLATHPLDEPAPAGPRFAHEPPALSWICFHVLQEYARHTGHLDVAVELAGGDVGE